ncbi:uncharacterized protein [Haliotis cracherodii]|uniref:uncharacterized protein n=1 Tax=Haliotis cracherodii TaxID=6455 RepID=UPI0039EA5B1E
MRCLGPRKWRWILTTLLIGVFLYLVNLGQQSEKSVRKDYVENLRPSSVLSLRYPKVDKWDLEHILGTFSEHRSIKRNFAFPSFNPQVCSRYITPGQEPCVDNLCHLTFSGLPDANLQKAESYPTDGVDKLKQDMLQYIQATPLKKVSLETVVIVTGSSSEFFHASQGLLHMLHTTLMGTYSNIHLVFYDLGLQPCQRKLVEKYCRCEVKDFPFHLFPAHVGENMKSYAWKPLLIQLELLQHRYVTWMDSSIRLLQQDFHRTFQLGINNGIMVAYGEFSMAQQTDLGMFRWFKEEPCLFSSYYEVQPGYIIAYGNSFTMDKVMRPWVACALNKTCILPDSAVYDCDNTAWRYGKCHRHDQSAISIILTRLFQRSRELLHLTRFTLKKRQKVHYFPEEPSWLCWLW